MNKPRTHHFLMIDIFHAVEVIYICSIRLGAVPPDRVLLASLPDSASSALLEMAGRGGRTHTGQQSAGLFSSQSRLLTFTGTTLKPCRRLPPSTFLPQGKRWPQSAW